MTYVMQQLGNCEMIRCYLQRNSSTCFPPKHQFDDFQTYHKNISCWDVNWCKKSCCDVKKHWKFKGRTINWCRMFSHNMLILNIFNEINPNHLIQLIYTIQIQQIWTAQLFRCFAVTQLLLALLFGLTSWTKAMFSNFQGGFSNPWTFHNIAGLRLYDAAGIYKEPWSWLWQRKCGPRHAEVPGHCQWIECWTIMLCPACFSRTTNCSPMFSLIVHLDMLPGFAVRVRQSDG